MQGYPCSHTYLMVEDRCSHWRHRTDDKCVALPVHGLATRHVATRNPLVAYYLSFFVYFLPPYL